MQVELQWAMLQMYDFFVNFALTNKNSYAHRYNYRPPRNV